MSCPVCLNAFTKPALTGGDWLFESTSKIFTLHACASCHCLFLDPMPADEEIARFYPPQYWWNSSESQRDRPLKRLESIYRKFALRDHVAFILRASGNRDGLDLLDVGCGSGTLLGLLKRHGFRPMGVDFSAEAARIAEIENGVRVLVGSLEQSRFPDEAFDVVTLFHVMEHVSNPRSLLAEVSRILKPGGALVLQVPNIDSWQFKAFGVKWYGLDVPRHVIDYSRESMLKLLKDSEFVLRRVKHFNLRDNAPAFVSSLFPSLDPVSRAVRHRKHGIRESTASAWLRHSAYLSFVICAYPFAILESAFGRGATLMIEARKKTNDTPSHPRQ
jgi:2-polyprenyl-3-methyl-5-hydroxy-6-metoxy-1,4-benzoquinol methylase